MCLFCIVRLPKFKKIKCFYLSVREGTGLGMSPGARKYLGTNSSSISILAGYIYAINWAISSVSSIFNSSFFYKIHCDYYEHVDNYGYNIHFDSVRVFFSFILFEFNHQFAATLTSTI